MFKLPIRTWVRHAAAVCSGEHGSVTRQAQESRCRPETVYPHACKIAQRLDDESDGVVAELRAENPRRHQANAGRERETQRRVLLDKDKQRQFLTTACAMGVSLRQAEDRLGVLLPPDQVPDHSTLGRWVADEANRAGAILAVLDPACVGRVQALAIDEICLGGGPPGSGSSARA
jgi:hypothetical protein